MFWMRDEGWWVKSWSWWVVKGCEMQGGVYAYRKEPFPLWRDSSLCCASFRMTRFCFLLTIRNLNYFWNAKIFFILIMYLREQSWRNSFAMKRGENWCGDVVMWWCGYVVMRWKSRIRNLRHWVLCKTTAPIDNATLTDTIFFSPTLKGGKLFIVSCEFWVFLYAKIFLFSLCF